MKVKVLIENNTIDDRYKCEHGLSLYIETGETKLLFDTGKSDNFSLNAKELGVDLSCIDSGIISHGHYDHSGGLNCFLELNKTAPIYINKHAYGDYYSLRAHDKMTYIGMDKTTLNSGRIKLVDSMYKISNNMTLISGVRGDKFFPSGNKTLFVKEDNEYKNDTFIHEQNLVVEEGNKVILFAGCAHNGILNIIDFVENKLNLKITHVFSGLHLYNNSLQKSEDPAIVNEIARIIQNKKIKLWTGHCTGAKAYKLIKEVLKDDLQPMSTGTIVQI